MVSPFWRLRSPRSRCQPGQFPLRPLSLSSRCQLLAVSTRSSLLTHPYANLLSDGSQSKEIGIGHPQICHFGISIVWAEGNWGTAGAGRALCYVRESWAYISYEKSTIPIPGREERRALQSLEKRSQCWGECAWADLTKIILSSVRRYLNPPPHTS